MTATIKAKPTATKSIEDVAAQAKETMEGIVKASQEQASKQFEQTIALTKEQVEKASRQLFQSYDELASFNKQNLDAVVQSGNIVAKGVEDIGKAFYAYTQTALEQAASVGKALLGVKTVRELVDVQAEAAKSNFDAMVAESTKLTGMSVKVANEAFAPLNARVNAAVEKFAKPLAA